jgi:hypothetical protein
MKNSQPESQDQVNLIEIFFWKTIMINS